ncbi:hypothetical protein [Ruegeria sp. MALMAid1280]|uniref:hypothetical protein n=1 Tax=Ruegeria sp. MALMAid1280 TaxID=3411634 RepID=UPI003B9DE0E0
MQKHLTSTFAALLSICFALPAEADSQEKAVEACKYFLQDVFNRNSPRVLIKPSFSEPVFPAGGARLERYLSIHFELVTADEGEFEDKDRFDDFNVGIFEFEQEVEMSIACLTDLIDQRVLTIGIGAPTVGLNPTLPSFVKDQTRTSNYRITYFDVGSEVHQGKF